MALLSARCRVVILDARGAAAPHSTRFVVIHVQAGEAVALHSLRGTSVKAWRGARVHSTKQEGAVALHAARCLALHCYLLEGAVALLSAGMQHVRNRRKNAAGQAGGPKKNVSSSREVIAPVP